MKIARPQPVRSVKRAAIASAVFASIAICTAAGAAPRDPIVRPGESAGKLPAEVGEGQPVLLHFWATWCAACQTEFPKLKPLLLGLPARGVAVALVSIDTPEQVHVAGAQLDAYGLSALPSYLLDAPKPEPVAKAIGRPKWDGALPATFLYDRRGKLVRSFIGQVQPAALEKALGRLKRRARAGTPTPAPPKG